VLLSVDGFSTLEIDVAVTPRYLSTSMSLTRGSLGYLDAGRSDGGGDDHRIFREASTYTPTLDHVLSIGRKASIRRICVLPPGSGDKLWRLAVALLLSLWDEA